MPEPCPFDACDGVLDHLSSLRMHMCCNCCAYFKDDTRPTTAADYVKGRDEVLREHAIVAEIRSKNAKGD